MGCRLGGLPRVRGRPHLYGAADYDVPMQPLEPPPVEERERARWLMALLERFGPDAVAEWQDAPPGWCFDCWCASEAARAAGRL